MITINQLRELSKQAVDHVVGLNKMVPVIDEAHLSKQIKDKQEEDFPLLVTVIPSHSSQATDPDNIRWNSPLLFFILKKINRKVNTPDDIFDYYHELQEVTKRFIDWMKDQKFTDQYCGLLKDLQEDGIQIEPEYNYFGCDGYSISFNLINR